MGLAMSVEEREKFLAGLHVGVIAIERADGPPLAVPIWYDYRPGGDLWVLTTAESLKGRLLQAAGRFSLAAQALKFTMRPERWWSVDYSKVS